MTFISGGEVRPFRIAVAPTAGLGFLGGEETLRIGEGERRRVVDANEGEWEAVLFQRRIPQRERRSLRPLGVRRWREGGQRGFPCRFSFAQRIMWRGVGLSGVAVMAILSVAFGAGWGGAALGFLGVTLSGLELRRGWVRLSRRATTLTTLALFLSLVAMLAHGFRETLSKF